MGTQPLVGKTHGAYEASAALRSTWRMLHCKAEAERSFMKSCGKGKVEACLARLEVMVKNKWNVLKGKE